MDTFKTSESIVKLLGALSEFHKAVGTIKKNAQNPFFHSTYAPLEAILPAIEAPLEKAGLEVTQIPHGDNFMTTIVAHVESGEYMSGTLKLTPVDSKPQSQGSAITYARRYMVVSMLRLNTDKDDDGNKASGRTTPPTNKEDDEFFVDLQPTDEEIIEWQELLESSKTAKEARDNWKKIPPLVQAKLEKVKDELKAKLK